MEHKTVRVKSLYGQDNHVSLVEQRESLVGEKHDRKTVGLDFGIYNDSFGIKASISRYYAKSDRMTTASEMLGINLTPENAHLLKAIRDLIDRAIEKTYQMAVEKEKANESN